MARLIPAGTEVSPVSVPAKALRIRLGALFALAMALGLGLGACSPALNWRSVTLGDVALALPCKPDHAQRKVSLGGENLEMDMVGCEADGALFAVSRLSLPKAQSADQLQAHWQSATLQLMKAQGEPVLAPPDARPHRLPLRMLSASGQATDGRAVQARLAWVAAGPDMYHFAVYATRITPEMAEPFFDGVKAR